MNFPELVRLFLLLALVSVVAVYVAFQVDKYLKGQTTISKTTKPQDSIQFPAIRKIKIIPFFKKKESK